MNGPSVGAMENWGLITCRENALIVDPQDASPSTLRKVNTGGSLLTRHLLLNAVHTTQFYVPISTILPLITTFFK